MMNGWFIFNSRFSDVRELPRITKADHGRSSQVNAIRPILPATPRQVSEASQNLVVSCFAPGVIWHRMEDGTKRRRSRKV